MSGVPAPFCAVSGGFDGSPLQDYQRPGILGFS